MGPLGFLLVAGGALSIWAGFTGVKFTVIVGNVLTGKPMPTVSHAIAPGKGVTDTTGYKRGADGSATNDPAKVGVKVPGGTY